MPEISVITGAYNVGRCFSFSSSIESILNQTFRDIEFIICDDGSDDNTWELLCHYAARDSRIRLLRNERNIGLAASLNKCLEIAEGAFIARHDCDDISANNRLELQLSYLKEHPEISVLGCQSYLFDENGVWGKDSLPLDICPQNFLFNSPYRHGSVVFRREALLAAGGYRVSKETYRTEDYDLFMTLQTMCKGANLPDYLYYFCENSATKKRRKYRYRIDEVKIRLRGFRKLGLLPAGLPYVVKPLVVGLISEALLDIIKDRYYKRKT